jgi:hypothetical protein
VTEPCFSDKDRPPTQAELLDAVGAARHRWLRLDAWARDTFGVEGELLYFGRDSGWCVRYRRSGKALFTLIPRDGSFGALVVIGPSAWENAATVELSPATRAAWDAAHPYPDGRWLWLDVTTEQVAADVERLVALKSPPPKRRRVPVESAIR